MKRNERNKMATIYPLHERQVNNTDTEIYGNCIYIICKIVDGKVY